MRLLASGIGSSLAFFAVRRLGWRVMGLFFSREQFERYRWMCDARRSGAHHAAGVLIWYVEGLPDRFRRADAHGLPLDEAIATVGRIP